MLAYLYIEVANLAEFASEEFVSTSSMLELKTPLSCSRRQTGKDESREIASEYRGGLDKYEKLLPETLNLSPNLEFSELLSPTFAINSDPFTMHSLYPCGSFSDTEMKAKRDFSQMRQANCHISGLGGDINTYLTSSQDPSYDRLELVPPLHGNQKMPFLKSTEEILLMQVFVEEVGTWMDSMDSERHFSSKLPFYALSEPMLLNAFLACGARHLTLVNPNYHEDKALQYYDTATRQLLRSLREPEKDIIRCATTAVVLNVYEIMSEKPVKYMKHIDGARALIKECGWSARSTGIGAACFWLNLEMEILRCLHFNWQVTWEPDQWGVDLDFHHGSESSKEDIWVHRILYIVGRITNFRASLPQFQMASNQSEQIMTEDCLSEWRKLKILCDGWNASIPQTMQPIGFIYPSQTGSMSAFPEVWLINRTTIVSRLFYHTAMILLAQTNPSKHRDSEEMRRIQLDHAHMVCGITAHVKDRGVFSVALRSLAIAAECLVIRREQEEILRIFEKLCKETGWRVSSICKELRVTWGWVM
ncbi:hypothetical protein K3495_g309 [Podosphaera aphanis]|nr:hypothetical protein K3495_g309 [Podosphaera aphanis]